MTLVLVYFCDIFYIPPLVKCFPQTSRLCNALPAQEHGRKVIQMSSSQAKRKMSPAVILFYGRSG